MSRITRVIIQNSYINREEVNNRKIRYLSDLSIFNLLSVETPYIQTFICISADIRPDIAANLLLITDSFMLPKSDPFVAGNSVRELYSFMIL